MEWLQEFLGAGLVGIMVIALVLTLRHSDRRKDSQPQRPFNGSNNNGNRAERLELLKAVSQELDKLHAHFRKHEEMEQEIFLKIATHMDSSNRLMAEMLATIKRVDSSIMRENIREEVLRDLKKEGGKG